jgi:predicted DNA-binding transcriptional regulator YafY
VIDPYVLIYKENVWYLYAFCHTKQDFRTFKVGRIRFANLTDKHFVKKEIKREDIPLSFAYSAERVIDVTLQLEKDIVPDVEEWLGVENIEPRGKGLFAEVTLKDDEALPHKILSYGGAVKVIAPKELQERVKAAAKQVYDEY